MAYRNGHWERGASNSAVRGSAASRRSRRRRLEQRHAIDDVLTCARCGVPLLTDARTEALGAPPAERFEVDRIVPGALGGTYADNNVQPACRPCNNEAGQRVRGAASRPA